ncbi:MAG TPA: hypothetical protein VH079_03270 [Terriglobales bacterium]|jgi:hypothetical protein|nr:hypothetical protein [Terriglobales bacterium]
MWKKTGMRMAVSAVAFSLIVAAGRHAVAQQQSAVVANATNTELPDSPGVTMAKLQQTDSPQNSSQQQSNAPASSQPQPAAQSAPKPEGTAAAGANPATGVAASQPAGIAIAPAKQHRTRTIVLRTGAILGAGVALGSVFALTEGTSSKPPGAH